MAHQNDFGERSGTRRCSYGKDNMRQNSMGVLRLIVAVSLIQVSAVARGDIFYPYPYPYQQPDPVSGVMVFSSPDSASVPFSFPAVNIRNGELQYAHIQIAFPGATSSVTVYAGEAVNTLGEIATVSDFYKLTASSLDINYTFDSPPVKFAWWTIGPTQEV